MPWGAVALAVGLMVAGSMQARSEDLRHEAPMRGSTTLPRTVRVGPGPVASVVVARTDRVFVVNGGQVNAAVQRPVGDGSVSVLAADTATVVRTVRIGVNPRGIAADEQTERVFVLNEGGGNGSVSVLDARTGAVLQTVAMRGSPQAIAVDIRTQRAFVATADNAAGTDDVSVLDARTGAVLRSVTVGVKTTRAIAVDERAGRVVVVTSSETRNDVVALLDARTGAIVRTTPVGYDLGAVAVDALTARAFVLSGNIHRGVVEVLDTRTDAVIAQRRVSDVTPLVLTVDTRSAHTFVLTPNGAGLTSVTVLDARSGAILPLGGYVGHGAQSENPTDLVADARRRHLYALAQGPLGDQDIPLTTGIVAIFDTVTGKSLRTVTVGKSPQSVSVDEQTGHIFVSNRDDDTVSVIDGARL